MDRRKTRAVVGRLSLAVVPVLGFLQMGFTDSEGAPTFTARWLVGLLSLVAALIGLYFASRLNNLTRGGVIASNAAWVLFAFSCVALASFFGEIVIVLGIEFPEATTSFVEDLLGILSMVFFAIYFYRVYRGFSGYAGGSGK